MWGCGAVLCVFASLCNMHANVLSGIPLFPPVLETVTDRGLESLAGNGCGAKLTHLNLQCLSLCHGIPSSATADPAPTPTVKEECSLSL